MAEDNREEEKEIDIFQSALVPKQEIVSPEERQALLEKFNIHEKQLPRMKATDPVAKAIGGKKGDIIKITRKSYTAGESLYYRLVV